MGGDIVVTGAAGFLGRALCSALRSRGASVRPVVRHSGDAPGGIDVGDIGPRTDWSQALKGADRVIHCAARVHMMNDSAADPLAAFLEVNTEGTANLAKQAATAGIRRFVFVSSIKVNGEETLLDRPFNADDIPNPQDDYGVSKAAAEGELRALAAKTGMEWVVVRPPLVYGPGVKANFASMMRWLSMGVPLPFGAIVDNRRSLMGLDNLVDLLVTCLDHPFAANQVFLASDGEDLSTTALLRRLGTAIERPARLLPVPPSVLRFAARVAGKGNVAKRILGDLQVDTAKTRDLLDWEPPVGVDEGFRRLKPSSR